MVWPPSLSVSPSAMSLGREHGDAAEAADAVADHDLFAVADRVAMSFADVSREGRYPSLVLPSVIELALQRGAGAFSISDVVLLRTH